MGAEGRYELATWFEKVLQEIEEDRLYDPDAIEDLKSRFASALADWRVAMGYGAATRGSGPSSLPLTLVAGGSVGLVRAGRQDRVVLSSQ